MSEFDDGTWLPKVLVIDHKPDGWRGSGDLWARADLVVTTYGVVLKNKYGPTTEQRLKQLEAVR
jgi:hypothetical protein